MSEVIDIAVVGGGPAGLTAALYGARARARTVVFEGAMPGGQIVTTDWLENYPGFPEGVSGQQIGEQMREQAERFGAELRLFQYVRSISREGSHFLLGTDDGPVETHTVILATGVVPNRLGVPGEEEYTGRGVSWCAVCDGALFRDKRVAVVGGGDAAVEEAIYLTKFAKEVHLIHRRDALRATMCIQERCFAQPLIDIHWNRVVSEIAGEGGKVTSVVLKATNGDPDETLPVDGVFIYTGTNPKSELVKDTVDLDDKGYVRVDPSCATSFPGLFAAGDVTDNPLKQVVTAAGQGAQAASSAVAYMDAHECNVCTIDD